MKSNLLKNRPFTSLIIALLIGFMSNAQQFDASKYDLKFNFKSSKQSDNTRLLETNFTAKNSEDSKDELNISEAEIKFYNVLGDKEVLIGKSKTSKEGIAKFTVPSNYKYLTDQDGSITIDARFEGSDAIEPQSEVFTFKDLHLELVLTDVDSVRTVTAKAYLLNSAGEEIPVEADLYFYAGGMISKIKLEDGVLEEGALEYEFEYTTNLPGNVDGNLNISVAIEDHPEFGNVTQMKTVNWGVANQHITETNKLWSDAGPIWMYIVLTILLVGVYANFIYTMVNLYKIKKEGDKIVSQH
ncbi:MAG: hypothetical protein WC389_04730 [Lutibacter sp.]|jgi:hypothetical protein